jgi:hypothetical protein
MRRCGRPGQGGARQAVERGEVNGRDPREAREERGERTRLAPPGERGPRSPHLLHRLLELLLHALGREPAERRRARHDRVPRRRLDRELEPRREADRAQRPEPVLAHPVVGHSHGAHDAAGEVTAPVVGVVHRVPRGRVRDRVDREVAPREVVVERGAEGDPRVAAVGLHVAPEGGDLVHAAVAVEHAHGAELDAHRAPVRRKSPCTSAGRAEVATSQSRLGRPSSASRTAPPTHQVSCPAAVSRATISTTPRGGAISGIGSARCSRRERG